MNRIEKVLAEKGIIRTQGGWAIALIVSAKNSWQLFSFISKQFLSCIGLVKWACLFVRICQGIF